MTTTLGDLTEYAEIAPGATSLELARRCPQLTSQAARREAARFASSLRLRQPRPIGDALYPVVLGSGSQGRDWPPGSTVCLASATRAPSPRGLGRHPSAETVRRALSPLLGLCTDHVDWILLPSSALSVAGHSLDLALLVSAVSLLTGIPVSAAAVFTGRVVAEGGEILVARPEGLPAKLQAVDVEAPGRHLVAPPEGPPVPATRILDGYVHGWRGGADRILSEQFALVQDLNRNERWAEAAALARTLQAAAGDRPDLAAPALWMQGAAHLHQGNAEEALRLFARAAPEFERWRSETEHAPPGPFFDCEFVAHGGIGLLDVGRPRAARELLLERIRVLDLVPRPFQRYQDWGHAALQIAGSLARVEVALGRPEAAVDLRDTWCLARARVPSECARSQDHKADALRRLEEWDRAAAALDRAEEALAWGAASATRSYVDLTRARLAADRGRWDDVEAISSREQVPWVKVFLSSLLLAHPGRSWRSEDDDTVLGWIGTARGTPGAWTSLADGLLRRWARGEAGGESVRVQLCTVTSDDPPTSRALEDLDAPERRAEAARALLLRAPY